MNTYISILRGINVSGQKIIKMQELKYLYEELNFVNVQTYIQSGNVVFQCKETRVNEIENNIYTKILNKLEIEVPVIVLTTDDLYEIIHNCPFVTDTSKLNVTIFSSIPDLSDNVIPGNKKNKNEKYTLVNKAFYLYCPDGYGKTKLNNTFLEKTFKVKATTRNWKTLNTLYLMSKEIT